MALILGSLLIVCGWHYVRVWAHFGKPLVGNWDACMPFAWWQEPGYHTWSWYARFGQALVCPLFSSFNGLADGIYSSCGETACAAAPSRSAPGRHGTMT